MEKWTVRNVKFNCEAFAKSLGVSNIVARLLVNRDLYKLDDAKSFLNSNIDNFEDYNKLLGMDKAIQIMKDSIDKGEKILIVGDYDVDGGATCC